MRYRTKPHEVDAVLWTGGPDQLDDPVWLCEMISQGRAVVVREPKLRLMLSTSVFDACYFPVEPGDFIYRLPNGDVCSCSAEEFLGEYEEVL